MKVPWPAALALVFCSGLGFLLLTVTGARQRIIDAIPQHLKIAIACGIGLFIAFIGLQKGGVIVSSPATLLTAGKLGEPRVLMVLAGILVTAVLHQRRVKGAIVLSVLLLTLIGIFVPAADGQRLTQLPARLVAAPASLAPTFLAFDFRYVISHATQMLPLVLAFLFVDLFDNMGTLIGVCSRLGLMDDKGRLPGIGRALKADAAAAMVGASLGTSTVTSYIESAAGAEEGGRTGLTAIVVAICFLAAVTLHPLLHAIPAEATAPALVVVGILMMQGLGKLDLQDFVHAVPCVLTVILMPLTFSISEGLAIGFVAYVTLMVGSGRARQLSVTAWVLAAIFLLHLVSR